MKFTDNSRSLIENLHNLNRGVLNVSHNIFIIQFYRKIRQTKNLNSIGLKNGIVLSASIPELVAAGKELGIELGEDLILSLDISPGAAGSLSLQFKVVSISLKHLQTGKDKLQSQTPFPLHIDGQNML